MNSPKSEKIFATFAAIKGRKEQGMRELYDDYAPALYHHILRLVPEEQTATDLLQEVFVKIWEKIETYSPSHGRPFTWMARIARNRAIDHLRSASAGRAKKTDGLPTFVNNSTRLSEEQFVDHIGLQKVLSGLDSDHRMIIDFLYFRGYSQSEAAKELNLPLGTVKTRSRRALQQLRSILSKELLVVYLITLLAVSTAYKILQPLV